MVSGAIRDLWGWASDGALPWERRGGDAGAGGASYRADAWWGFPVVDRVCLDEVRFLDHETGQRHFEADDFFEFLAETALRPRR
ncbi:hypothetical protein [Marinitenerispora sediminis]|uniref:Uncharacterized protein n=1 Tax=Marinitenerispora sediminis TaxID=1931232 RepID=A0A368T2C7_9ACTN|nr:hypothetical protein [Marinitenerispora sediminis]RCV48783.1 hypothetical protein DEF28_22585 [Marinitenerispora sediminis]RCV50715.1 hypothetical protein DEF23_21610 [Marinitenerispora sediminis]RCV55621.1 hypothetical protein DEF24_17680 [Marinitenerispora sediminis]